MPFGTLRISFHVLSTGNFAGLLVFLFKLMSGRFWYAGRMVEVKLFDWYVQCLLRVGNV